MHTNHQTPSLTCREAAQFNKALHRTGLGLCVEPWSLGLFMSVVRSVSFIV